MRLLRQLRRLIRQMYRRRLSTRSHDRRLLQAREARRRPSGRLCWRNVRLPMSQRRKQRRASAGLSRHQLQLQLQHRRQPVTSRASIHRRRRSGSRCLTRAQFQAEVEKRHQQKSSRDPHMQRLQLLSRPRQQLCQLTEAHQMLCRPSQEHQPHKRRPHQRRPHQRWHHRRYQLCRTSEKNKHQKRLSHHQLCRTSEAAERLLLVVVEAASVVLWPGRESRFPAAVPRVEGRR